MGDTFDTHSDVPLPRDKPSVAMPMEGGRVEWVGLRLRANASPYNGQFEAECHKQLARFALTRLLGRG